MVISQRVNIALELRVEDSSGKVTKEQLVLQVGGANEVPSCEVLSPDTQTAWQVGDSILFDTTASDPNISATELAATRVQTKTES